MPSSNYGAPSSATIDDRWLLFLSAASSYGTFLCPYYDLLHCPGLRLRCSLPSSASLVFLGIMYYPCPHLLCVCHLAKANTLDSKQKKKAIRLFFVCLSGYRRGWKHRRVVLPLAPTHNVTLRNVRKILGPVSESFRREKHISAEFDGRVLHRSKKSCIYKKIPPPHHHLTFLFLTPRSSFFLCECAFMIPNYHVIARFWVWGGSCLFGDLRLSGKLVTTLGVQ